MSPAVCSPILGFRLTETLRRNRRWPFAWNGLALELADQQPVVGGACAKAVACGVHEDVAAEILLHLRHVAERGDKVHHP